MPAAMPTFMIHERVAEKAPSRRLPDSSSSASTTSAMIEPSSIQNPTPVNAMNPVASICSHWISGS
ncbi:hypothetical protein D3C83_163980 [compost metagenome]